MARRRVVSDGVDGGAEGARDSVSEPGGGGPGGEGAKRLPATGSRDPVGETITFTWGKELFSPTKFHTYEVGPFTETTTILPGETREQARGRLRASVQAFAEAERVRKRDSYIQAMHEMVGAMKGAS